MLTAMCPDKTYKRSSFSLAKRRSRIGVCPLFPCGGTLSQDWDASVLENVCSWHGTACFRAAAISSEIGGSTDVRQA